MEAAIEEFEGVLLFVSHDRYFIEKFAERIWLLEDGKIRDFPCGYQKYRSILEHEAAAKPAVSAAPKPKKERAKGGTKDADKLVRRLEREIEKQEQVVADFDRKIEAASADYQELTRLLGEKEEAEAAEKAVKILGGKIRDIQYFDLPGSEISRSLVIIEKVKNTPGKYPRKAGTPLREPLA